MTCHGYIHIKIYSLTSSNEEASEVGEKLASFLQEIGETSISNVKPYWKIQEYYECSIELNSPSLSEVSVQLVVDLLGKEWERIGEDCFVWNYSGDKYFADERVRWASVEFIK